MKKILIYSILLLSLNVFSQSNLPVICLQYPASELLPVHKTRMPETGNKISGLFHKSEFGQDYNKLKVNQQSGIQLYDSIYHWGWDTTQNSGWKYKNKYIGMVYDVNNNLTNDLTQIWNGSTWINANRNSVAYNSSNKMTIWFQQLWYGTEWEDYSQNTYTYDVNNNQTGRSRSEWDTYSTQWRYREQYLYTYDNNNNCTSETHQSWMYNGWNNDRKNNYTYDAGNKLTTTIFQNWNGSSWNDQNKSIYSYDANNKLIHILEQGFTNNEPIDIGQYIYSYDVNYNLTMVTYQDFNGSTWEGGYQVINTYDLNNNRIKEVNKSWDWNENAMFKSFESNYTYDADNFTKSFSYKRWNNAGLIISSDSTYYYYHTVASGINKIKETDISLFPNPGNGKFTISGKNYLRSVEIYNIQGILVYADSIFGQQTTKDFDLTRFPKGIYFIKVMDGAIIYNKKIIIK